LSDVSGETLTGYLVALLLLFILYVGVKNLLGLETPDRFAKNNMNVGRES